MAFAAPKNLDGPKMQTKMSMWTPLNHQLMNDKVFEERRNLLGKWFDKWTDSQRRRVLVDFLERCSLPQLKFCAKQLQGRVPAASLDFTTKLPRVLSLYIFSFLDPRSLSRCAQVSWHWKHLAELDQLWMPKCLRFGWYLNFSPSPFEQGVWKRHYIEVVNELQVIWPKVSVQTPTDKHYQMFAETKSPAEEAFAVVDVQPTASEIPEKRPSVSSPIQSTTLLRKKMEKENKRLPPWRSSDKHPTDTIRFNYLDNFDPIEQARQARKKGGGITPDLSQQASQRKKKAGSGTYKLRKAKSLQPSPEFPRSPESSNQMSLSADCSSQAQAPVRPSWATYPPSGYPVTKATAKILSQSSQWNAGVRPGPVREPVPRLSNKGKAAFTRTHRTLPTSTLFESQPWEVLPSSCASDEEDEGNWERRPFKAKPLN